ncbi:MAG: hypothetical protein K9N55_19170 [Phycisphaerae bacterium]|nr:hypothetical protein [Phycisphaerae bacterium]
MNYDSKKPRERGKIKPPGYYCRVCKVRKLRDEFPGMADKGRVCKACATVSTGERLGMRHEEEIYHFLRQANFTEQTRERLDYLAQSKNKKTRELAELMLQVAKLAPYKKGRLKILSELAPDLLKKLQDLGLVATYGK